MRNKNVLKPIPMVWFAQGRRFNTECSPVDLVAYFSCKRIMHTLCETSFNISDIIFYKWFLIVERRYKNWFDNGIPNLVRHQFEEKKGDPPSSFPEQKQVKPWTQEICLLTVSCSIFLGSSNICNVNSCCHCMDQHRSAPYLCTTSVVRWSRDLGHSATAAFMIKSIGIAEASFCCTMFQHFIDPCNRKFLHYGG